MKDKLKIMLENLIKERSNPVSKQWYNKLVNVHKNVYALSNTKPPELLKVCSSCSSSKVTYTNKELDLIILQLQQILNN